MNSVNLKASVSFVGDGSTNRFYFGFDYINKQFVKVQVGVGSSPLTYLTDYTVDDRSVTLTDTPAVGVAIRVYRETPSDRIVEWADGAFIKASQMTLESLQQLHLIEEAHDYPILNSLSKYPDGVNFNALGSRVVNVRDPEDPQDVVTKHYMESVQDGFVARNTSLLEQATTQATNAKNSASSSATSASQSASSASASETSNQSSKKWAESTGSPDLEADTDSTTGLTQSSRSWALYSKTKAQEANTSATNAKSSEAKAKTSETNAKSSETKALTSEQNAKTSETNAKTSETNARASETNARASEINAETAETDAVRYSNSSYSYYIKARDWAESTGSPDGENDSLSTTGKTRSARGWAMQAKEYAGSLNLSFILDTLLPVGTVYMTENANFDPNKTWGVGVWINTAIDRVLQGTNDRSKVGTTIDAGLPNITGKANVSGYGWKDWNDTSQGSLAVSVDIVPNRSASGSTSGDYSWGDTLLHIDASRSNPIYGSSDTVQPPAELVFIWKRIY